MIRHKIFAVLFFLSLALAAYGQADRHDVRAGNRKFRKGEFKQAEVDYRKAVMKDSTSLKAQYNLASSLYKQDDYEAAGKVLSAIPEEGAPASVHFNSGDVALKKKDYAAAVQSFRNALLLDPDDLDAKENYIYAKKMLQNQQNGGGGQNDDKQNQRQPPQDDKNKQDNQNNQDNQNQNDNRPQDNGGQQPQGGISPQQAQQMLKAVQAKEDETRSKVEKEKAALLQSKQKEKNW